MHLNELLSGFDFTLVEWGAAIVCAALIGMTKTGMRGFATISIIVFAHMLGGMASAAVVLPMLSMGDAFGVYYYNRHAEWKYLWPLVPWVLAGLIAGVFIGERISDEQFKMVMGLSILTAVVLMARRERKGDEFHVPTAWWFSGIIGLLAGISTMIGNAAGPLMSIYLLSMRLPKNAFIGTAAWYFFLINLTKIPLHIFVWGSITMSTFLFDLMMLPAIALGAVAGVLIVKRIPENIYRPYIMIVTAIGAILLLL